MGAGIVKFFELVRISQIIGASEPEQLEVPTDDGPEFIQIYFE